MRKTTLFACLLLSLGANANATYNNSGYRIADETPSTAHNVPDLMPGDPPVIVRVISHSKMDDAGETISQNAPPTVRDSRTDTPPVPQPVPAPVGTPMTRSALTRLQIQSQIGQSLLAGGFITAGFAPAGTPIIRDDKTKPPVPAPVPTPPAPRLVGQAQV